MSLTSWVESLRARCSGCANSSRRRSALQSRASRRRLGSGEPSYVAEQLEDRTLLSVSAILINGTLNVTASGADNFFNGHAHERRTQRKNATDTRERYAPRVGSSFDREVTGNALPGELQEVAGQP